MPARQNIILGDRIPRIISICVCVVAIFPLLTADYLQKALRYRLRCKWFPISYSTYWQSS